MASKSSSFKGNSVSLKTFLNWDAKMFGKKVEIVDGQEMVTLMWCKLCAKYKAEIERHLKGVAKTSALSMAQGTNFVAKHSLSKLHLLFSINCPCQGWINFLSSAFFPLFAH